MQTVEDVRARTLRECIDNMKAMSNPLMRLAVIQEAITVSNAIINHQTIEDPRLDAIARVAAIKARNALDDLKQAMVPYLREKA